MFLEKEGYKIMLENLPDAFAYHQMVYDHDGNPVDYIFLEANPAFETMTGLTRDEIINRKVTDVLPGIEDSSFNWIETYAQVAAAGKSIRFEQKFDLFQRWYEITAYSNKPGYFVTFFRDITKRIELENKLREGERSHALLLSNLPGMAYRCDFDRDWTMRFISEGCYKLTGYKPEDLLENRIISLNDIINPEYREFLWHKWQEGLASREIIQAEYTITTSGGEVKWVWEQGQGVYDEDGNVMALEGFITDITDRKKAEEDLIKSEESLSITLQSIGDGVIATDKNGLITGMNLQAEKLTGWTFSDAEGHPLMEIFHIVSAKTGKPAVNPVYTVIETGKKEAMANDTTLIARDKTMRHIADSAAPIYNKEGDFAGVVMVFSDVTEQYRARQAIKESESRFRLMAENAQDLIYRYLLFPQPHFEYVSPSSTKILGYTPEEHYADPDLRFKLAYPDDQYLLELMVKGDISLDQPLTMRWVRKDGRLIWIEQRNVAVTDEANNFIAIEGIARDITELKEAENEILRQKAHFEALFTNTKDAIVYFDNDRNILNFNVLYSRMFGYGLEEVKGKNLSSTIDSFKRVTDYTSPRILNGEAVETESVRYTKSGQAIQVLIKGGPVYVNGVMTGGYAIYSDISDRKHAEIELKYMSLHDKLTGVYNRAYFEEEIDRLDSRGEYPITIMSADIDGLKLINDTMGHDVGDKFLKTCSKIMQESLRGTDILARVGGDEFIAILPSTDEKTGELIVKRIQATTAKYNKDHHEFPISISIGIATAVDHTKSLKEVFKKADDLMYNSKLHKGTSAKSHIISILMTTLGERDYIIEGHGRRLSEISNKIGIEIGLTSNQLDNLNLLAQVHDLGKVGIPDHILFKKGPLTKDEWEIMRQHAEKGYRIAVSSPDLSGIADLILKHHEKWDGTGYPLGIRGKEIPIECRVISIVDAFDAITNDRPYSKAKSVEESLAEIKRCAGIQFDPELVEVFASVIKVNES